jgi:Ca2+-binding EF-hand superfamily protein
MSALSSVSGLSNAWANASTQRSQMQAKMFAKVDADSSGGIDQTELQALTSDISSKTGSTLDATKLFSALDGDGDKSISSDELAAGLQSVMPPPPSTVDFAQSRTGGQGQDDLFSKVDSNSDGSLNEAEMSAFTSKMKTETGKDSPASFATLDSDSDGKLSQTEFEAGRPGASASTGATSGTQSASVAGGPQGAGGPPPTGGPGGAGTASASSSTSTTYDPLDTNEDGTVSEMERLAGALKDLISAGDSDSDSSNSSSKLSQSVMDLAKLVYEQIAAGGSSSSSSNALSVSV